MENTKTVAELKAELAAALAQEKALAKEQRAAERKLIKDWDLAIKEDQRRAQRVQRQQDRAAAKAEAAAMFDQARAELTALLEARGLAADDLKKLLRKQRTPKAATEAVAE